MRGSVGSCNAVYAGRRKRGTKPGYFSGEIAYARSRAGGTNPGCRLLE